MQYCTKCSISIRGNKSVCPLCGGRLHGEPSMDVFPVLQKQKMSPLIVLKIALFLFFSFLSVMLLLIFLNGYSPWMGVVIAIGMIAMINIILTMYFHNNPIKTFHIQSYVTILLTLCMRKTLLIHNLFITWFYPFVFLSLLVITFFIAKLSRFTLEDYVIYYISATLFSFTQYLFIWLGWNTKPAVALICIEIMIVFSLFVIIFHWKELKNAARKYLNL